MNFQLFIGILSTIASVIMGYQALISIAALFKNKKMQKADRTHRFALVVCARNEEMVIGHLLDSLFKQNYPKEAFDVFVVADNCSDETARVAHERGAKVYVRHNAHKVGKGYALNWFFNCFLKSYPDQYDAVGIFDADNLVDPQFLSQMNLQLCAGEVAAMGYRDSKNPQDSWVSGCMSLSFWTLSRFYLQPRSVLGLSAMAGGTGYVFKTSLVQSGWNTHTISEDTEFSMNLIAEGHRIAYAPGARFYDEQPVGFAASLRQRRRWATGTLQCLKACMPRLVKALGGKQHDTVLDAAMFLLLIPACSVNIIISFVQQAALLLQASRPSMGMVVAWLMPVLWGSLGIIAQGLATLVLEKKLSVKMLWAVAMYPFFLFTTGLCYLFSLIAPTIKWKPIEHRRGISLGQLERGSQP